MGVRLSHRFTPFCFLSIMGAVGLTGCALPPWGTHVELTTFLPTAPVGRSLFGREGFVVVVPDETGDWVTVTLPRETRVCSLRIEKKPLQPILAYPRLGGRADLLRPAGGVFPATLDARGRLSLRYEDGFLAELLVPLMQTSDIAAGLNVKRLREEIWFRSGGNPWSIDQSAILETLGYAVMRSSRIKLLPTMDLDLAVPQGSWIWENPLIAPLPITPESGLIRVHDVPIGVHHLFRVDGESVERMSLYVGEDGWFARGAIN